VVDVSTTGVLVAVEVAAEVMGADVDAEVGIVAVVAEPRCPSVAPSELPLSPSPSLVLVLVPFPSLSLFPSPSPSPFLSLFLFLSPSLFPFPFPFPSLSLSPFPHLSLYPLPLSYPSSAHSHSNTLPPTADGPYHTTLPHHQHPRGSGSESHAAAGGGGGGGGDGAASVDAEHPSSPSLSNHVLFLFPSSNHADIHAVVRVDGGGDTQSDTPASEAQMPAADVAVVDASHAEEAQAQAQVYASHDH